MRFLRVLALTLVLTLLLGAAADAWVRLHAVTFATLPAGFAHPEGITADRHGNIYVTTFDVTKSSGPGQLFIFKPNGELLRQVSIDGSSNLLLDLAFHPISGALLVIDFGNARVLDVDPVTGVVNSIFTTIPDVAESSEPQAGPGPNVLTFDRDGNVYISDSFQGRVWKTGPAGGDPVSWLESPLLRTAGVPPFGANGLAFNKHQTALFVANTGNDTVLKVPVSGKPLVAGTPEVFANSVNGADGLIIDDHDNVWVAANQADEIVVLNADGRHIAKLGDFNGVGRDGRPNGLLFPASLVRKGHFIYVTNLAIDLRLFNPSFTTGDSEWTTEVSRHTISVIPAFIPPVQGLK
jgi:DNA-binding beta-propeller fold protein YncE